MLWHFKHRCVSSSLKISLSVGRSVSAAVEWACSSIAMRTTAVKTLNALFGRNDFSIQNTSLVVVNTESDSYKYRFCASTLSTKLTDLSSIWRGKYLRIRKGERGFSDLQRRKELREGLFGGRGLDCLGAGKRNVVGTNKDDDRGIAVYCLFWCRIGVKDHVVTYTTSPDL